MSEILLIGGIVVGVLGLLPVIVSLFLRDVEAGTIRLVSWLQGTTAIYRGPGKSKEIPLLTTGTTISSKVLNVDLDITDQTADIDEQGFPQPIKVRVLASAIVSVGDSDSMIKTAANRFFAKPEADQISTLTDLLSSSGRRAINLLTHDQLFSAKTAPRTPRPTLPAVTGTSGTEVQVATGFGAEEDDDIRSPSSSARPAHASWPIWGSASIRSTSRWYSRKSLRHGGANPPRRRRPTPISWQRSKAVVPKRPSSRPSG